MATLLEQIANIKTLIDNLEALAFGDDATSVTHDGTTRDSLAKAIKGKFDALQAMVQGRLAYETKAAMDAAGAPPAGELAEVWNDPTLENNGLYGWDGSSWLKSPLDSLNTISRANILFSPFMDAFHESTVIGGFNHMSGVTFIDSVNSPYKFKTASDAVIDRRVDITSIGVKEGDIVRARCIAWYENSDAQMYIYFRDDQNSVISQQGAFSLPAGLNDETLSAIVPVGAVRMDIRAFNPTNNGAVEMIAHSVCIGYGTPDLIDVARPEKYQPEMPEIPESTPENICPDSLFIRLGNGDLKLGELDHLTPARATSKNSLNPHSGYVAIIPAGAGVTDKKIPIENLGIKLGDVLTIKIGVYAFERFSIGAYFRDSGNSVIGSTSTVSVTPDAGGEYQELSITRTVDQATLDSAARLDIRLFASTSPFDVETYWCATAIYKGNHETIPINGTVSTDILSAELSGVSDRVTLLESESQTAALSGYYENINRLREFRQRTRSIVSLGSSVENIAFIGDSWTQHRGRYAQPTAKGLQNEFGKAGTGWVSFSCHPSSVPGMANTNIIGGSNFLWSSAGGSDSGSWTFNYFDRPTPDLASISSSTAGDLFRATLLQEFDTAELFFIGTADGVVRYSWDNGATWESDQAVQGTGLQSVAMTGVPSFSEGAFTNFRIEVVSGSVELAGMNTTYSSGVGVVAHKLGASGSRADHWTAVDQTSWQAGLSSINPDTVVLLFGTNDQASRTVNEFDTNMRQLISNVKAALPAADILVVMPCENQRVNTVAMADMAVAARAAASDLGCAYLDLQAVFGDDPADYAAGSDRPWFNADLIHPEPSTGGPVITDALIRALMYS